MLEDGKWFTLESYVDGDYEVSVEGTNIGDIPEDKIDEVDPDYYQVYYKPPWEMLIAPTKIEPSAEAIHSALSLVKKSPKFLGLNARLNVLRGLFVKLWDKSKEQGYCIICRKIGSHDANCSLDQAMRVLRSTT